MDMFSTAIILAGGQSSRMGFDKQLIEVNQVKLMDFVINKLEGTFKNIIIVTNKPELYDRSKVTIVSDLIKQKGPLSGIHSALSITKSKYAFVVACDMPNVNYDYIEFMKSKLKNEEAFGCITRYGDWIEPFHAFYSVGLVDRIEQYLESGRRSIYGILKEFNVIYVSEDEARKFSPNWDMFININTRDDLCNYLSSIKLFY